jgi:DNA-binding SARP family transcriptional activator/WD40 repeat protein
VVAAPLGLSTDCAEPITGGLKRSDRYRRAPSSRYRPGVRFGVLGRLEVRREDGTLVRTSGPVRRQLLAALLCRVGSAPSAATLIDDLWGTTPPRTALNSLRTHMARLRDDLGRDEHGSVVRTEGDGYRLALGVDDLDAVTFERLVVEAAGLSDPMAALHRHDEALGLWRDEAYIEFGEAPFAVSERIRLAELRAVGAERRTDLALGVGMAAELVGDLEARVQAEPYRERGWEQLALAQYRAGRQADALATYRRARRLLAEDLGVDPGPALRSLEERFLRQDPDLLVDATPPVRLSSTVDRCPYLGLAGYEELDAPLFVGRERVTSVLAGRLSEHSVVVLTGASGVGKSSLVRAGLIPALRSGALPSSTAWRVDVGTPTGWASLPEPARPPDLLVLDQAEEMFTSMSPDECHDLACRLTTYVDEHWTRLLLVMRSDFYGRLVDVDVLAPFAEKTVVVGPMRADELRRALVEPAAANGVRLEPDLVETIMEDVGGQPEPLPLLSEAMVRTWRRREGDLLTLEGYRLAGGVAAALEAAAEECYARLGDEEQRAVRHLLVRMAARTSTGWTRRPLVRLEPTSGGPEQTALAELIAARLVVASDGRVEITHDALLAHWPRLRDWLSERALAADLLHHLDQAATVWVTSGRQDADLYRGPRLTTAVDWRTEHPEDISSVEGEFLDASERRADAELESARAQVVREVQGRRRLRAVVMILTAVLIATVVLTVVAVHERSAARTEAGRARQAALVADARRLAALSADAPDIATSSLLAVAAYRLQDDADSRGALLGAIERNQSALWRIPLQQRPQRVVTTADGSLIATIDNNRDIEIFNAATRREVAHFPANGYQIVGLTADDRSIIVFGPANTESNNIGRLSVVDIATGRQTRVVTTAGARSGVEPAMTPDSRWLVLPTDRRRKGGVIIEVYDTTSWTTRPRHIVEAGTPVALGAGRSAFAVERADGHVEVRALPSLRRVAVVGAVSGHRQQPEGAGSLAVSRDGTHVARVDPSDPRSVTVDPTSTRHGRAIRLPTQVQGVTQLAFSPDGSELVVATLGGSITVYRTRDGTQAEALAGHAGAVQGLAWPGSGTASGLYSVGLDSQLVSWSVSALPSTVTESGPDIPAPDRGEVFGHDVLGLTPAQETAPQSRERGFLLDLDTGRRIFWHLGLSDADYVNQAVANSDGNRALLSIETGSGQNRIEIWDLTHHIRLGHLQLPAGSTRFPVGLNAAISLNGRQAYCSLGASRIGVFDLPSGRLVRDFTVRFASPDAARIDAVPWMFDPSGRLLVGGFDPPIGSAPPSPGSSNADSPDQRLGLVDVTASTLVAQTKLGDVRFPTAAAWSHDGTRLAIGTGAGTLALYDAATLSLQVSAGVVEPGWVKTVSFSPDDQTLVTGGTGGAIDFYTVPDLRRMGNPLTIGSPDSTAVFAWYGGGGQVEGYAADVVKPTTTTDQRWFVFRADPASLASTACSLAGADITDEQWQRYVGDRPYRHVCPPTPGSVR